MTTKEEDTTDESFFSTATQSLLLNMDVPNTTFTQQKQQTTVKTSSFNFKEKNSSHEELLLDNENSFSKQIFKP